MAIYSLVKFDGFSDREWILYYHPVTAITNKSKLIVGENQLAIIVSDKKVGKVFNSGLYEFNGENFPFISGLGMRSRENDYFAVEVYFFNKSIRLRLPWGTKNPIEIINEYNGYIRVRARGEYTIKVINFQKFIINLVTKATTNNLLEYSMLASFLRSIVVNKLNDVLNEYFITSRANFMRIYQYNKDLEKLSFNYIADEYKELGLQLDNFSIIAINVFEEDLGKIKETFKEVEGISEANDNHKDEDYKDVEVLNNFTKKDQHECPKCGKFSEGNLYCPYCGSPMKVRCVLCNHELTKDDDSCPKCGTRVSR